MTHRLLALHFGALGDFVLSWPALGLFAGSLPGAELTLAVRPEFGRLLLPAERVLDRDSTRLLPLFKAGASAGELAPFRGFAAAAVFSARPDPDLMANLESVVPRVVHVPTRPGEGDREHAGDRQARLLAAQGFAGPAAHLAAGLEQAPDNTEAVLAPGSGGRDKRLTPEQVRRILAAFAARDMDAVLILGPAEDEGYREEMAALALDAEAMVVSSPPLALLARYLSGAACVVGADSGVTHLGAALGRPTLAVFRASDPDLWAPRGPAAAFCREDGLDGALEDLLAAIPSG